MKRFKFVAAWAVLLGACPGEPPVTSSAPGLLDFAYAIELRPSSGEALQSLLLPLAVYRGTTRPDLGDLRVFDPQQREVPHALRTLGSTRTPPERVSVPLFPLYEPALEGAAAQELSLVVERASDGTVIDLRSKGPAPRAEQAIAAYVLDVRAAAATRAVRALQLELEASANNYVTDVTIEVSRDLTSWDALTSGAALVRLDYAGQRIEQDRIELSATRGPFLRLRARSGRLPGRLNAVSAELMPSSVQPTPQRLSVAGKRVGQAEDYDFDLGGALPVQRVSIELPQDNSLVHAQLQSRASPNAAAEPLFSGALYRVHQNGRELQSAPIELDRLRRRYFRLHVEARGGGLAGQRPVLQVDCVPDQLLFIARGPGPFQLAYGRAGTADTAFSADQLRALDEREQLPLQTVTALSPRALAGASALRPRAPPPPIKIYTLWAVLIVAAGAVLLMALRMLRQ